MASGLLLWLRNCLRDLTGLLLFLFLFPVSTHISSSLISRSFFLNLFHRSTSDWLGEGNELVIARLDLSRQALDCLDVVEAEPGHLLWSLLDLLNTRGEITELALLSQDLICVLHNNLRLWQIDKHGIHRALCHTKKFLLSAFSSSLRLLHTQHEAIFEHVSMRDCDIGC